MSDPDKAMWLDMARAVSRAAFDIGQAEAHGTGAGEPVARFNRAARAMERAARPEDIERTKIALDILGLAGIECGRGVDRAGIRAGLAYRALLALDPEREEVAG